MIEKSRSRWKKVGGALVGLLVVALLLVLVTIVLVQWTHRVSVLIPVGAISLYLDCFLEYATYKWLLPFMDGLIRRLGQEPQVRTEIKTFRQWFVHRRWDLILVVVFDVVVLVIMAGIFTKFLGIPW